MKLIKMAIQTPYSVHVNYNQKPFEDKGLARKCSQEIQDLALETIGFKEAYLPGRILPYVHFVAVFDTSKHAIDFLTKLVEKEYVGRIAIKPEDASLRTMERPLPE